MTPSERSRHEHPSRDVDETSDQSFPSSDPPPTWSSAGRDDPEPGEPAPLTQRRRRVLVRRTSRIWLAMLAVAVLMVATAVIGLAVGGDGRPWRTVAFTATGLLGAAMALVATIWRGKVGDDLDEAKLD